MDPEAQLTVEDWKDITACVIAAAVDAKTSEDREHLDRLTEKCLARAKALVEGRVMP